jgi:tRNA threonylcarbamoyladenosine biosynthesis protein TsaE
MPMVSRSPEETLALATELAALLQPGDIILLQGDLGTGKTEFVRGLAQGLGLRPDQVSSPTFALIHEYPGSPTLIHVDLYRLTQVDPEMLMTLEDYWQQPVITVIEWAERLQAERPPDCLEITFRWLNPQTRALEVQGYGPRGEHLAQAWQEGRASLTATERKSEHRYG